MGKVMRYLAGGAIAATLATANINCNNNNETPASRGFGQMLPIIGSSRDLTGGLGTRDKEIPASELKQLEKNARAFLVELKTNRSKYPTSWFREQLGDCAINTMHSVTRELYVTAFYTHDARLGMNIVAALAGYPTVNDGSAEDFKLMILKSLLQDAKDPKVAAAARGASLRFSMHVLEKRLLRNDWEGVHHMFVHSIHSEMRDKAVRLILNHGGPYAWKYTAIHSAKASGAEGALGRLVGEEAWGEVREVAESARTPETRAKALKELENAGRYSELTGIAEDSEDAEIVKSAIAILSSKGQDERLLDIIGDAEWSSRAIGGENAINALEAGKKWEAIATALHNEYEEHDNPLADQAFKTLGRHIPELAEAFELDILEKLVVESNGRSETEAHYKTREAALDALIKLRMWDLLWSIAQDLQYEQNSCAEELRNRALAAIPLTNRILLSLNLLPGLL